MAADRKRFLPELAALEKWLTLVSEAATKFERRWTMLALRRVDPDLATRLFEQRQLFDKQCVSGGLDGVSKQGEALLRGYAVVVRAMEAADMADDAYMVGSDPSGLKVAIGTQRATVDRVREVHGRNTIWVTPDEVAAMLASMPFKRIADAKRIFPGAEIIEFRKTDDEEGT